MFLCRAAARVLVVGLTLILVVVGPTQVRFAEALTTGTVSGTVTDGKGAPLAGVHVGVPASNQPFAITDASGAYSVPGVQTSAGPYDVWLLMPCNRDQTKRVVVDGNETVDFSIPDPDEVVAGYRCSALGHSTYIDAPLTTIGLTGDEAVTDVALPFAMPFFGTSGTSIRISTNGFLAFSAVAPTSTNRAMPQTDGPNGIIAPFWDDVEVDSEAAVRVGTVGTSPGRVFVVEWRGVYPYGEEYHRLNFEAQLAETGEITFAYEDIHPGSAYLRERGASATVGIESPDGTRAVQRSFNQSFLDNDLGIRLSPK